MATSSSKSSSESKYKRPSVETLQRRCTGIFINNEFRHPSRSNSCDGTKTPKQRQRRTFPVSDPGTGEILCEVERGESADVESAVRAAAEAFSSSSKCRWRNLDLRGRGKLLNKLADLVERDADAVAEIEAADGGKPVRTARLADVESAIAVLRAHASFCVAGRGLGGRQLPLSSGGGVGLCYTKREPVGVVAGILPFNFPLCGAVAKIAPAIAAGCTIVIKPSDRCPLSPLYLCSLIVEAGFPPGVVNAVPGDHSTGQALVSHPLIAKVSFTGSNAVGKEIVRVSSERLARVTLELGGKNPCIICPLPDGCTSSSNEYLQKAAKIACGGNFFNAGQICVGISRVFVPNSIYDEFVDHVKTQVQSIVVGDQFSTDDVDDSSGVFRMGPLVDERQLERVLAYIQKGIDQGAKLVCGTGKRIIGGDNNTAAGGYFIEPTVLADVADDNICAIEEIFGPVMCIQRYNDADDGVNEAVRRANNTKFGLAAVVISNDINAALNVADELEAGTVWVNTHGVFDPVAPYQGHKQSGLGSEYGAEGLSAYLKTKTVMVNRT